MTRRELVAAALAVPTARRPNIVFVLVDDLRWDELKCTGHPFAQTPNADRLAREGALFRNAFATTPLCSPSRGSFLTGLYPHTHGIIDNTDRSPASHRLITWPRLLHDAGYQIAFLGKWHMGNDDSPRPGFDHWVSFPGQGETVDPVINVNGSASRVKGYVTDILNEQAVNFIDRAGQKPFCVYVAHKAIHPNIQQRADGSVNSFGTAEEFIPAPRHRTLYAGAQLPHRKNYGVSPVDKPALHRHLPGLEPLGPKTATDDATILNRMRMSKAIDEGLGQIYDALVRKGQLDNTIFIYTSDHGYFYGEHGLNYERRLAYEETIRIPLLIRYPRVFKAGSEPQEFALSIDIAPTVLELAGLRGPRMQGQSLAHPKRRDAFLIEYFSDTVMPRIQKMGYRAVRTNRWKYIQYRELEGMDELYDLSSDPFELRNIIGQADRTRRQLQERLGQLAAESHSSSNAQRTR